MTPAQRQAARARLAAATPRPWDVRRPDRPNLGTPGDLGIVAADGGMVGEVWGLAPSTSGKAIRPAEANADLIINAPADLAAALDALDALDAMEAVLRALVEAVEDAMESPEEAADWAKTGDMRGYLDEARRLLTAGA